MRSTFCTHLFRKWKNLFILSKHSWHNFEESSLRRTFDYANTEQSKNNLLVGGIRSYICILNTYQHSNRSKYFHAQFYFILVILTWPVFGPLSQMSISCWPAMPHNRQSEITLGIFSIFKMSKLKRLTNYYAWMTLNAAEADINLDCWFTCVQIRCIFYVWMINLGLVAFNNLNNFI